jgi:betaine lipid synthase
LTILNSQGHLLELKLAAMLTVDYADFFSLFGLGKHPDFRTLLDTKIAPLLSSNAYQFWRLNSNAFNSSFYMRGYAGWALRLSKWMFWLAGVSKETEALCKATTIEEQERIWKERLRPIVLNKVVVALLKNPVFCWNALGVPLNQRRMFLNEGSAYEFIKDTMDPLASHSLFSRGAYFYLLVSGSLSRCTAVLVSLTFWQQPLIGNYDPLSCPDYLTEKGFQIMRESSGQTADSFRLHTGSIMKSVILYFITFWDP